MLANSPKVWAPSADVVNLMTNNARIPLEKNGEGFWENSQISFKHGQDYAFIVDGSKPLPDPMSMWQPNGVHNMSRYYDHNHFKWDDQNYKGITHKRPLIYELHVGTFTTQANFKGVIEKLDYLKDLGVNAIELLPVCSFSGRRGWGYDGVNLFAPHECYGGPDGLKKLVNEAHKKGISIILDVVYNHFGPEGNYLSCFGPYFTDKYKTPWGESLNFDDTYSDTVRKYFLDNVKHWIKNYHIDGLRLDAVHAIVDTSATHILEEISNTFDTLKKETKKDLLLISESDLNDPKIVRSKEKHGYGHDSQWLDDFHHIIHTLITKENSGYYSDFNSFKQLIDSLNTAYIHKGDYSVYRKRSHGRSSKGLKTTNFVTYIQNHDQIGNRAIGDRLHQTTNNQQTIIAASILFFSPFIPMIFQGEEWASNSPFQYFTDHSDKVLGEAVSIGRKNEFKAFGWSADQIPSPQEYSTFERSILDWNNLNKDYHLDHFNSYKKLINLNRQIHGKSEKELGGFSGLELINGKVFEIKFKTYKLVINSSNKSFEYKKNDNDKILFSTTAPTVSKNSFKIAKSSSIIIEIE